MSLIRNEPIRTGIGLDEGFHVNPQPFTRPGEPEYPQPLKGWRVRKRFGWHDLYMRHMAPYTNTIYAYQEEENKNHPG